MSSACVDQKKGELLCQAMMEEEACAQSRSGGDLVNSLEEGR